VGIHEQGAILYGRSALYEGKEYTNVFTHFKWELKGKLRIHSKPSIREISACRPWLDAEVNIQ
jgi:uracil-DNA glycosylase